MAVTKFGDWKYVQSLGTGGFGEVLLYSNDRSNKYLAIKKCKSQEHIRPAELDRIKSRWNKEIELMSKVSHPNIVRTEPLPKEYPSSRPNELPVLCMEYCDGGNLRTMLNNPDHCCGIPEVEALTIIQHISAAVKYLHEDNDFATITHRDLKPENIIVSKTDNNQRVYKLIDLGYAKEIGDDSVQASIVGTLNYIAPELMLIEKQSNSTDYWSLGILFYEVLTGSRPFLPHKTVVECIKYLKTKSDDQICAYTKNGEVVFSDKIEGPVDLSEYTRGKMVEWFRLVLQFDPKTRGREVTRELAVFDKLEKMLSKKVVHVFWLERMQNLEFVIDKLTQFETLQAMICRETGIPLYRQIVTDTQLVTDNKLTDGTANVWSMNETQFFLFDCEEVLPQKLSLSIQFPEIVLKETEKIRDTETLRRYYNGIVYCHQQDIKMVKLCKDAICIKIDLLQKRLRDLTGNAAKVVQESSELVQKANEACDYNNSETLDDLKNQVSDYQRKTKNYSQQVNELVVEIGNSCEAFLNSDFMGNSRWDSELKNFQSAWKSLNPKMRLEDTQKVKKKTQKAFLKYCEIRLSFLNADVKDIVSKLNSIEAALFCLEKSLISFDARYEQHRRELDGAMYHLQSGVDFTMDTSATPLDALNGNMGFMELGSDGDLILENMELHQLLSMQANSLGTVVQNFDVEMNVDMGEEFFSLPLQ